MELQLKKNRSLYSFLEEFFREEMDQFLNWSLKPLPPVIRVNTLKSDVESVRRRLEGQSIRLEEIEHIPWAFRVLETPVEIGRTLEHYLGYIYVQELASIIPVLVLDPKPGEKILDIAAAPGSKTTLIAQLMKNQGLILANDIDYERLRALASNLDRLGVMNVLMTEVDGYKLGFWHKDTFDRVLVDVPCSALGTLHRAPEIVNWWSWEKVKRLTRTQKGLILAGYQALKPGGVMVYSTCTLTPQENEAIVSLLLEKNPEAEILDFEDFGLKWSRGVVNWKHLEFDERCQKARRLNPYRNKTEGFFIALIGKPS
jgi:NOL1/NOP2/sun family putative RNA methylase